MMKDEEIVCNGGGIGVKEWKERGRRVERLCGMRSEKYEVVVVVVVEVCELGEAVQCVMVSVCGCLCAWIQRLC